MQSDYSGGSDKNWLRVEGKNHSLKVLRFKEPASFALAEHE